nr:NADH dehydrogenase subunit 2 [Hemigyrus spinosus spinosus]
MIMTPSKTLFLFMLMIGTLICISSTSWFGMWMGLEINLLSFIPLTTQSKNPLTAEASLKYFLIQAFASSLLLFSFILMQLVTNMNPLIYQEQLFTMIMLSSLLLKAGAAPFHFWLPGTMEGMSWINCLILTTWQKIAPLMIISYIMEYNKFMFIIIITSIFTGSLGGLTQTSLRKLMAYSSINHLGWMLGSMLVSETLWLIYLLIYTLLSSSMIFIFYTFQLYYMSHNYIMFNSHPLMKFCLYSSLLSLGGLPPFLGFLPKWMVIQSLTNLNQILLTLIMVMMTLVTLFYYMRLTFSAFLLSPTRSKWSMMNNYSNYSLTITSIIMLISLIGLLLTIIIWPVM